MKKMIIASTSTIHGSEFLEYLLPTLNIFFKNVKTVLFIPYARPDGISLDAFAFSMLARASAARSGEISIPVN